MKALLLHTAAAAVFLGIRSYGHSANDVSPRLADSPEAQQIRNLTLIGGSPSSPSERAKAAVKTLKVLQEELRARLAWIDARIREASESELSINQLRVEREKVLQNERKTTELIELFEKASENR